MKVIIEDITTGIEVLEFSNVTAFKESIIPTHIAIIRNGKHLMVPCGVNHLVTVIPDEGD